jgi:hypothetical protein
MLRKFAQVRKFSAANAPLSLTPKFFLLSYKLEDIEDKEGKFLQLAHPNLISI